MVTLNMHNATRVSPRYDDLYNGGRKEDIF